MNSRLEDHLRTAFDQASDFIEPRAQLASQVRASARRQRRLTVAIVASACVVLLVAASVTYIAAGLDQNEPGAHHHRASKGGAPRTLVRVADQIEQLAISGRYLYVPSYSGDALSAYDRRNGKLIHTLALPQGNSALAVGPGGLVWLAFYPNQNGGPTVIWLLSPDLRQRSAIYGIQTAIILPYGRTAAWVPTPDGLVTVRMPAPGRPGRSSRHLVPGTSLGPSRSTYPGRWAGLLDRRVVVQVTGISLAFGDSHLVIAGKPELRFGISRRLEVGSVTSVGSALWVQTFAFHSGSASSVGSLVRLDDRLRLTTPESVRTSPVLNRTEQVWSAGGTVWVATGAASHALVCFRAGGKVGPVTTVPVHGQVLALAATAGTVYVSTGSWEFNAPSTVVSYSVPAACR